MVDENIGTLTNKDEFLGNYEMFFRVTYLSIQLKARPARRLWDLPVKDQNGD